MGTVAQSTSGDMGEVIGAQRELNRVQSSMADLMESAAIDAIGIVDPTPISDAIGAARSIAEGDVIGATLSLISMVPYVGDALGKTTKGARLLKRLGELRKRADGLLAKIGKLRRSSKWSDAVKARKEASAAERARRKKEAMEKAVEKKACKDCADGKPKKTDEGDIEGKHGTRLPSDGKWDGEPGNSTWHPDPETPRGREILDATGGKGIEYKDGYPDFSPYSTKNVEIDMAGNHTTDFTNANAAAGIPGSDPPTGYTWHHNEDGVTMQLVPQDIHNNVPHTGGASIVSSDGF